MRRVARRHTDGMNAQDIIYRLKLAGKTQRMLAAELGVSHASINNTIHRRTTSYPIACAIAQAISEPVSRVFPDQSDDSEADR